ncbi:unnamed protein product [Caenorhabditis nigoni]
MSYLESDVPKILEELKQGFVNFSNRLKDGDIPETFKSDETSMLEKLEDKLKNKKEVLESRIHQKKENLWWPYIVGNLIGCMILFSNVIESFFYNTNQDSLKTFYGILQLFLLILSPFVHYRCIRTTILIDSLTQF